jgi:hypothetical protein
MILLWVSKKGLWVSILMQKLTGVSRVDREIFRIKSCEKVYRSASRNFCVTTLGLYTKFIEAEREHKCGKIQVSPALPDIIEGTEALVHGCGHNKSPLNAPLPSSPSTD